MPDWQGIAASVERLLNAQGALRSFFDWKGRRLHGVRATLRREDVNTSEGLAGVYAFSLLCPAAQFAGVEPPQPRMDKITVDGRTYRVLGVETDAVAATVRLHLGDEMA